MQSFRNDIFISFSTRNLCVPTRPVKPCPVVVSEESHFLICRKLSSRKNFPSVLKNSTYIYSSSQTISSF